MNIAFIELKPITELEEVTGLQPGFMPFDDGSGDLKKMNIDTFNNLSKAAKIINISDPTPTDQGLYKPATSGTYSNAGGLVAKDGYSTLFFFNGTNWSKSEELMPQATQFIPEFEKSSFPIIGPAQRTYNGIWWEIVPGDIATASDIPGESDKWKRVVTYIDDNELNNLIPVKTEGKSNRIFSNLPIYKTTAYNNAYPKLPFDNNVSSRLKFIQFNFKSNEDIKINNIGVYSAYVNDSSLNIGSGKVSLRAYKGVNIVADVSDFTNAELIDKAIVDIDLMYANAVKDSTLDGLKTKIFSGDFGTKTDFIFNNLFINKNENIYLYIGPDDDSYYTNTPNTPPPNLMISLITSDKIINDYLTNNQNPTFLFSGGETVYFGSDKMPYSEINFSKEIKTSRISKTSIDTRNVQTFIGAFNTVLDALFAAKPTAKIAIIGHNTLSGTVTQKGDRFKNLVQIQQNLADYWGCPYLPLWQKLNWVNNPPTNTFLAWCPDGIHPYSNPNKVSTALGLKSIGDVAISKHVTEFLRPIFGDEWSGKKIATYGTSIPYGGEYSILAAIKLGATGQNYCSSGSYIRKGNSSGSTELNSFTNTSQTTYRQYQKDMLDLIGTANEPDLYVFDFGINDYNLDQTDFQIF